MNIKVRLEDEVERQMMDGETPTTCYMGRAELQEYNSLIWETESIFLIKDLVPTGLIHIVATDAESEFRVE